MTRQRRAILGIIETASRHLDATQILRKAQKQEPEVDRVTIYRTLTLLKRHGLIDELDLMHLQGEKHFYERKTPREHVHMTCLRCGRVAEFESRLFDDLKKQVQKDCRFQIARRTYGNRRILLLLSTLTLNERVQRAKAGRTA
jgi:Fur family transcriptional regulator, ferric uptake regulator